VAELADAGDLKSSARKSVWVRPPPALQEVTGRTAPYHAVLLAGQRTLQYGAMQVKKASLGLSMANRAIAALVLVGFLVFAHAYVGHVLTIRNVDYFQFVDMAQGLRHGGIQAWVSGMHPVGYPLLIRLGLNLGFDAVEIGHGLSIFGGVLLLAGAYFIAYRLTHSRWLALATELILATTSYFLYFGTLEGNDMLSAGLSVLSLGLLIGGNDAARRTRPYLLAGALAGLGYVIRYTAAVPSVLCLVFLVGQALVTPGERRWIRAGMFLGGFLVGAALQLGPSLIVTGNPFYSVRGHDVWWHVEGLSDFATEWDRAPMSISALQVLLDNPQKLLRHWWDVARSFWLDPAQLLLDTPFRLFSQAGLLFTLLAGKRIRLAWRILLALVVGGLLAGLALIRYDPRFMIAILPVLAFSAAYFFWVIVPERVWFGRLYVPLNVIVLGVLCLWSIRNPFTALENGPRTSGSIVEISNILRAGGMREPSQVLSTAIPYHDVTTLERQRYPQSYWVGPDVNSPEALLETAREHGFRFVLYDAATGRNAHPGLAFLLDSSVRTEGLTPLWFSEAHDLSVYRIEQDSQPEVILGARFGDSIRLRGYDLSLVQDGPGTGAYRIGLFLYWEATAAVSESYKVFVHVLDESGALIAQDDSIPVLWSYPADRWQPGSVVVDFHNIRLPVEVTQGVYTVHLGLYSEVDPGQRLSVVTGIDTIADHVVLTTLSLGSE
jgi:hypothetical protein